MVCGEVSGGLEMFEFEGRAVRDGIQDRFKELAEEAGLNDVLTKIRNGYVERTPSGGTHVLWRCAEVEGNLKLARRVDDDGEIEVLIETRGKGGFTVIAPSSGPVHETGEPYVMVRGGLRTIPTITPAERRELINIARSLDEIPEQPKDSYKWKQATSGDGRPGDHYNDLTTGADVVALLERHGWERVHQFGDRTQMRRPGKSIGVSATVFDSGAFVCFTTSTRFDGYDQKTRRGVYSPFSVFAILEHNGDYSAAARALNPSSIVNMKPGNKTAPGGLNLPADFWKRSSLRQIRDAAWSRGRSPDVLLLSVLAKVGAASSHAYRIPPFVGTFAPVGLLVANIGIAGAGKSSGFGLAGEYLPTSTREASLGSGEGIAAQFYEKQGKEWTQTRHNLMIYADEGESLAALGNRAGSVLLPTIRSLFTGGQIGQSNATLERNRPVPGGTYVASLVISLQEDRGGKLLEDVGGGTPQRFLFASAIDPNIPPPGDDRPSWPGRSKWLPPAPRPKIEDDIWSRHQIEYHQSIWPEVQTADHLKATGQEPADDNAHHLLKQLKVAACLALLEQRTEVTIEDWELARTIGDTSMRVRGHLAHVATTAARAAELANAERRGREAVVVSDITTGHEIVKTAIRIALIVKTEPGITWSKVRRKLSVNQQGWAAEALEHATGKEWVTEQIEEGQGTPKRTLHPGTKRPPK